MPTEYIVQCPVRVKVRSPGVQSGGRFCPQLRTWPCTALTDGMFQQRKCACISSQRTSIFLRWSFWQPGLPQSFLVSREVFGMPIRPQQV